MTSLVRWLIASMLVMFVSACQTEPEDPKGPQTYTAEFSITEPHKIPTQVKWNSGNDSGDAPLVTSGSNLYQVRILRTSPPNSPIKVDLYRAGLLYYRLTFEYNGSLTLKLNTGNMAPNEPAIELLKRLGDKANDSSVAAEVARSLVDNDALIKSDLILAGMLPGLDTAKVMQEALKLLVAKNVPLKELVPSGKWILNIDTMSIHVRIHDLSLAGTIVADTNKLFPPYPVRATTGLAISGELQAGGGAIAVSGVFQATNKLVTSSVKIFQGNDDATTGFDFPVNFDLLAQPSKLDLSGKLSIAAKSTTAAGTYRLEIVLQDQDAFFAKATLEFVVTSAADRQGPSIEILSPAPFTILDNATSTVLVKAQVTDPSGVDSVWIDGRAAQNSGETWEVADVAIPVKDFGYTVLVVAKDKSGNRDTGRIVVGRKNTSNSDDPTTLLMSPTADAIFPFDSSSVMVVWKVEDPRSPVAKVIIDGVVATKSAGNIWSRRVEIPATGKPTTISLLAINEAFQEITKSFQVTRRVDTTSTPAKDTDKPRIVRQTGTNDRDVAYDVSEVVVGWTVSDASPMQVTIQGAPVTAKDGVYSATVVLVTETTVIRIEAIDSAKNKATDSVIIRRGSEPGAPVVSREPGTKDSAVAYSVTSLKLAWKISDASQVTLNGSLVQGVDGIYTIQAVPLKIGANGYKIVAKNATGKESSDTITISRAYHDSIFPVAVAEKGTKDTTVPNATESIALSWKVTDNDKLQSVTIGGLAATAVGDIYSATLPLKPGENIFELVASDTAKNTTKKSVTVTRTPDAGAPVIAREAGTKDSTVANATTSIKLSWMVTDDVAVASVEINGTAVTGTDGIYSLEAKNLAIGKNGFKIEAKDAGGKSSYDTLTIIRIGDTSAPKIAREASTKDSTVAYGTTSIKLSWKVTDDVGIASVEINGTVATGADGIYSIDAKNLVIGKNGFRIVAKDASGKSSSDSVTIVRIGDISAPVIVREAGTKDSAIAYGTTTLKLSWKVTDDVGIASVEINGTVITANAEIYAFEAKNLAIGKNEVKIVAKDVAGKSSSDLVTITRAWKDTIAPSIVRQTGTKPQSVPNGTTSISVSWTVTDSLLKTVTIQGVAKTLSSTGIYSATIPLTVGNNSVSIVAVDNQGNTTKDEFIVVREAPAAKHSATSGKYIGTVYDTLLAPGADSIQYSIDGINWKTAINGIAQVKATGVFSLTAKSFPGGAVSKIDLEMKQVKQIKSNGSSSWFVMEDGSAWATGNNGNGQLGTGSTAGEFSPIKVMSDVKSISAGGLHTLFLLNDGSLYATGANFSGELCDGTLSAGEFSPKKIASGVSKIAAGGSTTFYQIGSTLYGCGTNYNGQLAVGYTSSSEPTPLKIPLDNITTVSVGSEFSLFINSYRIASGAGNNLNGELGLGEIAGDSVPHTITADAVDISAGSQHAVFLLSDRSVRTTGGLGNGNGTAEKQTAPYQLSIPNGASAISASDRSTLILSRDGKLYFTGQLITTWDRWPGGPVYPSPTEFATDVASISAGGLHNYFIKADGTLWAFGWIGKMYGNETEIVAQTPVQINF